MPPQPRGGRGSRGSGLSDRGRGGDGRGRGDRGGFRGGGRGGPRGFQGRGRGGFPGPRYEAVEAPVYHPDPTEAVAAPGPKIAPGVVTVGVRRPAAPGTLGTKLTVTTNHFKVTIPESTIYQYHVVIEGDREMPKKWNQDLIRTLQEHIAPRVFTPRAVYDGRKNLFASRRLRLKGAGGDSQVFDVTLKPPHESERPPKVYRVKLKCVAEIDPALLKRYQEGQQSVDNMALTALTVMNVIIRMVPVSRCPFNTRSFFTDQEVRPVGSGIELWRGYLQSIRTGLHSMLINVDISTGMMFTSGPMIGVCQQILKNDGPTALDPDQGLNDRERICLQRFLTNVRFVTSHKDKNGRVSDKPKTVKKISAQSANNYMFDGPNGQMSVAQYFHSIGVNLRYSNYVCIETSTGAAYPIEFCSILPGQMMRKQVPPDVISMMLEFSTKKPDKRLNSIVAGHQVLQYGQSEYIREFGMSVGQQPEKCVARVLPTPALKYGVQSKFKMIRPANGSWNLRHQQLYEPADVGGAWAVIVYDSRGVREREAAEIICGLVARANLLGIRGMNEDPPVLFPPAEALNVHLHLQAAGQQVFQRTNKAPSLFLVVLPDNSQDLYQAIKHFGDVARGVATQCVRGFKSKKGSPQYWSGVCMKINAKLGGVNSTLDPNAQKFISDPESPVMIMGSDVMHPAPGAYGRPSFASMVGSIDSNAVHYTAVTTVQDSRVQIIAGVEDMVYEILGRHAQWKQNHEKKKNNFPKRIVYYRNGVSDGQFLHVLDRELPAIKAACKRHKINPTITVVVVRKRHHVRFFPTHGMADRSGNCPSGTVVDDVVAHPTEFNFYLQSQGGVIGTTRPTQYNVLHDENNFTMDAIQSLSFALCHVYARSTRAVSIPAPTYYADIVCERAKNHYDPSVGYASIDETDSEATASGGSSSNIQRYKDLWQPTHEGMRYKMYFL